MMVELTKVHRYWRRLGKTVVNKPSLQAEGFCLLFHEYPELKRYLHTSIFYISRVRCCETKQKNPSSIGGCCTYVHSLGLKRYRTCCFLNRIRASEAKPGQKRARFSWHCAKKVYFIFYDY